MVKHTQTIRRRNFLSVFDHFVGFALKKLMKKNWKEIGKKLFSFDRLSFVQKKMKVHL